MVANSETIIIAGGGMAGSLLALVLGRQGRSVVVVDPRRDPPPTFRNEKLGHEQIALLAKLGALAPFERACWPDGAYPDDLRPALHDCGAPHHTWLREVRADWPPTVRFVQGSVASATLSDRRQTATLADGSVLTGRLLVLAAGRLPTLATSLGLGRRVLSASHSVCLGFNVSPYAPVEAQVLPARFGTGLGYVSLFPMPGSLRVNVFSFRPLDDAWTRRMRLDPVAAVIELVPEASPLLAGARVVKPCEARGTDLYETTNVAQPGLLVIGDAFHAPCPASGTGMLRIANDVDAIANRWLPTAFKTPGVGADKIAAFYADPAKRELDAASLRLSRLGRARALDRGAVWSARRGVRRLNGALAAFAAAQRRPGLSPSSLPS